MVAGTKQPHAARPARRLASNPRSSAWTGGKSAHTVRGGLRKESSPVAGVPLRGFLISSVSTLVESVYRPWNKYVHIYICERVRTREKEGGERGEGGVQLNRSAEREANSLLLAALI